MLCDGPATSDVPVEPPDFWMGTCGDVCTLCPQRADGAGAALLYMTFDGVECDCPAPEAETCEQMDVRAGEERQATYAANPELFACTDTADCVLAMDDIACPPPGTRLGSCGVAVHRDQQTALRTLIDELTPSFCGGPVGCMAGPSCAMTTPVCDGGSCTLELSDP